MKAAMKVAMKAATRKVVTKPKNTIFWKTFPMKWTKGKFSHKLTGLWLDWRKGTVNGQWLKTQKGDSVRGEEIRGF